MNMQGGLHMNGNGEEFTSCVITCELYVVYPHNFLLMTVVLLGR